MSRHERYKDPVKKDKLLAEVEIDNRATSNFQVPLINGDESSRIAKPGKSAWQVYEDDISKLEAMVETHPELIKAAEQMLEGKFRTRLRDCGKHNLPSDHEEVKKERELLPYTVQGGTLQACFRELTGGLRDLLPLVSITVKKRGILPEVVRDPVTEAITQAAAGSRLSAEEISAIVTATVKALNPSLQQNNQQRR
jgi:hypothetical protein